MATKNDNYQMATFHKSTIPQTALTSLCQWSQEHIKSIFEAQCDEESMRAVDETFSPFLKGKMNGNELNREDIKRLVQALRESSRQKAGSAGLKVHWMYIHETPMTDSSNREVGVSAPLIMQEKRAHVQATRDMLAASIQSAGFARFFRRKEAWVWFEKKL